MTRRVFQNLALVLTPLAYAGGFAAAAIKYLSPLPPRRRKSKLKAAAVTDLEGGKVINIEFNGRLIHVLKEGDEIIALDAQCTHLDCNVNWKADRGCFLCPCHLGRFDRRGNVIARPPPSPLRRQMFLVEGGTVFLLDEEGAS